MGKTSFMQTSFLGGEWGPAVQGRMDAPQYKIAMNRCLNYYPVEEGSLMRRQGSRFLSQTRRGKPGRVIGFDFSVIAPYQCEFTDGWMRLYRGTQLVEDSEVGIASINTATPAEVTATANLPAGWATGDTVDFVIDKQTSVAPGLYNRRFIITKTAANKFTLADEITNFDIDGSTLGYVRTFSDTNDVARKIAEFATAYPTQAIWKALRLVQDETTAVLVTPTIKPYYINETTPGSVIFQLSAIDFLDGPYLDPNTTATTITPSGTSGSVTLTASAATGINNGLGFKTTDIGRLFRLFSSPAAWSSGTTYTVGQVVLATDGNVYTSLKGGNINHDPTKDVTFWALSPTGSIWTWAQITAWTSTTVVTALIRGDALLNTNAMPTWRLGVFSDTTGWPTCGGYHEGRLCLSGVVGNRIDGSKSNDPFNFAPTAPDGTVADNNAIAVIAKSKEVNQFFWMVTDEQGLLAGTQAGEWRMRSSTLDDPVTPTSVQLRRVSTFGSFNADAVTTSSKIAFIQRKQRKVMEFGYFQEIGGFHAPNLSLAAMHFSKNGIEEIDFQQEPTPTIWARRTDGVLIGCAYMRAPDKYYAGWHKHALGGDRQVVSISTGPTFNGRSESLYMVTVDPADQIYWVEMLTSMFDDDKDDWASWFTDSAPVPGSAVLIGTNVRYYGLWHLIGKTVQAFVAGLDLGDYVVSTGGYIDVPLGAAGGLFTEAYLAAYVATGTDFGEFAVPQSFTSAVIGPVGVSNSVRAYVGADGHVTGVTGTTVMPDDDNGFLYEFKNTGGATEGLRKFLIGGTSAETANANLADLGISTRSVNDNTGGCMVLDASGHIYFTTQFANTSEIGKFDTDLSSVDGFVGVPSSLTSGVGPFVVYSMATCKTRDGATYLLASTTLNNHIITLMSGDPIFSLIGGSQPCSGDIANGRPVICGGLPKNGHTVAYVMDKPLYGAAAVTPWRLHKVLIAEGANGFPPGANPGVSFVFIKAIAPADIDATWTNFSDGRGMAFDSTDGNVLIQVATTDAVVHQKYLVKISTFDGSVKWKTPITNLDPYGDVNMSKHRIVNGRLLYVDSGSTLTIYNTADGTSTTQSYTGISVTGGQISDDKNDGVLTFFGSYAPGTATPLGTYMIANGSATNQWLRVYAGFQHGVTFPTINVYQAPALFGLGYTSQAQLLRPDYGQDAGAQAGPAFGKLRRADQYAISTYRTRQVDIGTEFGKLRPVNFRFEGGTDIPMPTLLTGIWAGGLEGRNDFDQKIAWQQNRPFPGVFLAVAGFLETKDH